MIGVEDHALGKIPSVASHVTITLFLFILILVPGLFVENLGIVLELVGALCSCSISFLFPGLAVSFILHKLGRGGDTEAAEPLLDGNDENGEKVGKVYRIGNIVMLLFGFMTLVLATSTTVMKNLSKDY
jgi:amino acid permease